MDLTPEVWTAIGANAAVVLGAIGFVHKLIRERLDHLDDCIDAGKKDNKAEFEGLRGQVNAVHLEVVREYVPRGEFRATVDDLKEQIDIAGRLTRVEGALKHRS